MGSMVLLHVVHRRDGFLGVLIIGVPNETEASTPASVAVLNDDLIKRWKSSSQRLSFFFSFCRCNFVCCVGKQIKKQNQSASK